MLNTYGEIILSAKDLNKYLMENKDALIDGMSKWLGNFMLTMYSIQAEVMRLAMLLDKLGGTMSSAQMLLYGPGRALGVKSSTERFEAAADRNINYENRYKETEKELEKLAIRYNNLEQSISAAGLAAAKLARSSAGGNEEFNAKPGGDKGADKAAEKSAKEAESAAKEQRLPAGRSWKSTDTTRHSTKKICSASNQKRKSGVKRRRRKLILPTGKTPNSLLRKTKCRPRRQSKP